jgi:hypothetical protein
VFFIKDDGYFDFQFTRYQGYGQSSYVTDTGLIPQSEPACGLSFGMSSRWEWRFVP